MQGNSWRSEDGKWLYTKFPNGSIDMLPTSVFDAILNKYFPPIKPYQGSTEHQHIHWAMKPPKDNDQS
jgi:hypothetical protein